jgi:putative redox protein
VLGADEPETLGGNDTVPDPLVLVLAGLGACTIMTIRMYADRKQLPLEKIEVRLRRLQPAVAGEASRQRLERVIVLHGELTSDQRGRLLEIANHCPVGRMLSQGAEIVSLVDDEAPHDSIAS